MSDFYEEMAATVVELLEEFGGPAQLVRQGTPVIDPVAGTVTASEERLDTVAALFSYENKLVDGVTIFVSDRKALVPPTVPVQQGDKLWAQGQLWSLVAINQVNLAGTPVMYICQARA